MTRPTAPPAAAPPAPATGRVGLRALGPLALVGAGAWVFAALGSEVGEGETRRVDEHLLLALRDPSNPSNPLGPRWVEEAMRDLTALGGLTNVALLTAATVGFLLIRGHRRTAAAVGATVTGGLALSTALKHLFGRARPNLVPHGSYVYTSSFPSGHTAMSAVTFLTLAALLAADERATGLRAYLLAVAAVMTLAVGVSRVYLGVHYPSDVLAGWIFGATWSAACWFVVRRLRGRG